MQGGDISNGVPPRVMVHLSAIFDRTPGIKKVLKFLTVPDTTYEVNMASLSYVNRWRDKGGIVFEAFTYEDDDWPGDELWEELDEQFSHPFNRYMSFRDTENMSSFLAFSPDVQHVLDPLHPMRFGSKSIGDIY